jgi:hypothetical protein
LRERKSEIDDRLDPVWQHERATPVIGGSNLAYEVAGRTRAISYGGIGVMHELVRALGLQEAIDARVHVFKRHFPYHESDHVLNLVYNVLCGGTCLEDLEMLRGNPGYLDALGCHRVPDPTTAGDFLRRFDEEQVGNLMEAINDARVKAWRCLTKDEKRLACIDADGTLAPTTGECKDGMDITYKGTWGYHPLVISVANTQEILYTMNRPGSRPSHDDCTVFLDAGVALLKDAGFERVRLRGDTDFALTKNFDRWTSEGVEFVFGMDAHRTFVERADTLDETAWSALKRGNRGGGGRPRRRPTNVKEKIVEERGYKNLVLEAEHYAEVPYQPRACTRTYRMVILRKTITVKEGELRLADEVRYHCYVTNVRKSELSSAQVVFQANARCHQENLIEQMKNGVRALRMPSDTLVSNWAYIVIASLAWNLKAWLSICLPSRKKADDIRRMEFRRFLNCVIMVPCQVVRRARGVVLRLLAYSEWAWVFLDGLPRFKRWRMA